MKCTIIMPHRPLTQGHLSSGKGPLYQLPDGRWQEGDDPPVPEDHYREDIHRGIHFLRKNSVNTYKILMATDADVYPQESWLKEYEEVSIFKSSYIPQGDEYPMPYYRLAAAYRDSINSLPDDEWIVYGYTSDLICAKEWDRPIVDAMNTHGQDHVYIPMFVETRSGGGQPPYEWIWDMQVTPQLIWTDFRKYICCHALTMPESNSRQMSEEDFDHYIEVANQAEMPVTVMEMCGVRDLGYYDVMFMKAKYAKRAGFSLGFGFDLAFDNALGAMGLQKIVCTKSFVLHCWVNFMWERVSGNN